MSRWRAILGAPAAGETTPPIPPNPPEPPATVDSGGTGGIGGRIIAPAPVVPDPDAWAERAAIREYDGGAPRAEAERAAALEQGFDDAPALFAAVVAGWTAGLARLALAEQFPLGRRCIDRARAFIADGWATQALALGWAETELMGADPVAPWARLDRLGAAYLDFDVRAITADCLTYAPALRQWRGTKAPGAVLPWAR